MDARTVRFFSPTTDGKRHQNKRVRTLIKTFYSVIYFKRKEPRFSATNIRRCVAGERRNPTVFNDCDVAASLTPVRFYNIPGRAAGGDVGGGGSGQPVRRRRQDDRLRSPIRLRPTTGENIFARPPSPVRGRIFFPLLCVRVFRDAYATILFPLRARQQGFVLSNARRLRSSRTNKRETLVYGGRFFFFFVFSHFYFAFSTRRVSIYYHSLVRRRTNPKTSPAVDNHSRHEHTHVNPEPQRIRWVEKHGADVVASFSTSGNRGARVLFLRRAARASPSKGGARSFAKIFFVTSQYTVTASGSPLRYWYLYNFFVFSCWRTNCRPTATRSLRRRCVFNVPPRFAIRQTTAEVERNRRDNLIDNT